MTAGSFERQTRQLVNRLTGQLTGRERGPDHDPEGRLRTPRRDSYDADDDPRAKPWSRIGDGSKRQGLVYIEALIRTAKELYMVEWAKYPLDQVRAARNAHAALSDELKNYMDGGFAPIGRPAAIRLELAELEKMIAGGRDRLRRIDVTVLEALLRNVDFATGRLFPAITKIAERAGCHRNSVVAALRRLKAHGFIAWVRRSQKTGNDGERGPQREQTSNAYFFDHRRRMAPGTWQQYLKTLTAALRRLGQHAPPDVETPSRRLGGALGEAIAGLEAALSPLPNAST